MQERDATAVPGSLTPEERARDVYDAIMCSDDGPDAEIAKLADAIRAAVAEETNRCIEDLREAFLPHINDLPTWVFVATKEAIDRMQARL